MKQNTLILAGAALLLFLLMKKKGAAKMPANVTAPMAALPNIQEVRSQTVNFEQLAPSPSMVMDMPGSSYRAGRPYGCECNGSKLGDMPFVC
jgi:uncharacterized lipoprotein YbaY